MIMPNIHLHRLASVAWLLTRWPAKLKVASSIPGRGHQQCLGGNHCLHVPFSTRDTKQWVPCAEISAHTKEPSGGLTSTRDITCMGAFLPINNIC